MLASPLRRTAVLNVTVMDFCMPLLPEYTVIVLSCFALLYITVITN